jgi:integrase
MRAFKVKRNGEQYYRVDLAANLFADGKRHSVMAVTRKEAIDKAQDTIARRRKGLDSSAARTPLTDFLRRFLEFYKTEGGVSLRTWQDYRYHIDTNVIPLIGGIVLSELKPVHVDEWMKSLRGRGLGDRTVEYAQSVLRRALQFALEWELLDRNPAGARFRAARRKRTVKPSGTRVRFLNPEQARAFLTAVSGDRHEALYALAVTTGLRPEELYGLRSTDLDLPHQRLTVNQVLAKTRRRKGEDVARFQFGPPKTDRSRRTIDFPPFVAELLNSEIRTVREMRLIAGESWEDNGLIFPSQVGTPLEERNVLRRFHAICEANDLPSLRLYDLRHTHASLLIHEGVHPKKISERLGHSSIKLTMDTYGHLFEGSDRDSAEKMENLFGGEPKAPPDRSRVADKTADKNSKARWARAAK